MQTKYFIFGLQRSGTNYLRELISANFNQTKMINEIVYPENDHHKYWKHSLDIPAGWDSSKFTFIIHKNPYLWIESILIRRKVDFLKTQKRYPANDLHPIKHFNFNQINIINLAKTWKYFLTTWLNSDNLNPRIHMVIKYENLLDDQKRQEFLHTMHHLTKWDIKPKDKWVNIQNGKVLHSPSFNNDSKTYYQKQQPEKLNKMQTSAISQAIGEQLIRNIGYEIL